MIYILSINKSIRKEAHMRKTPKQAQIETFISHLNKHPEGRTSKELSDHLDCTMKTIQNYIRDLNAGFVEGVEMFSDKRGHYRIVDSRTPLDKAAINMEKKIYLKLAIETLENLSDISQHHNEIEKDLNLDNLSSPYYIRSEDYQRLNTDEEEIEKLEDAIEQDNMIEFEFKSKRYYVAPYRLVNFDGIWYLYGKDLQEREENSYKTWMLKYIDNVEVFYNEKHDTPDEEISEDLKTAYSAQFVVDRSFDVTVKVYQPAADIFIEKNHLPNQHCKKLSDGSLLVTSTISTYADIDPEIKSWIPYIEVMEPLAYKEKFLTELEEYLVSFK